MLRHLLLTSIIVYEGVSADCGTTASKLEDKCNAYPSLSHFYDGKCFVLELRQQKSVHELTADRAFNYENVCQHLNGYRARLASVDDVTAYELKSAGVLGNKRNTITASEVTGRGQQDATQKYPYLCEYEDEFYCPEGYSLRGIYCYKVNMVQLTHKDAEVACRKSNGSLAALHDEETAQFIAKMAADEGVQEGNVHIALQWNAAAKQWSNTDGTVVDYFRWLNKEHGAVTMGVSPNESPEAVLNAEVNNAQGVGTFGYMDIVRTSQRAPSACQVLASNSYGQVVAPESNLWSL
ncbi:Snaclec stejaggregin-A subunit beta-2 [Toxocara canis]|uniref:Snaclec stejaggregin-A subunit beta-2 n=2 Tax=Toxocara canis TaxID=6265 RepID=A0A0B2UNX8_TOXCA|nr:Snaclec stejaggregin-A subunit beta-2 [Toxocara canis]VDM40218.1 unnamed protein product [Toxocara canis]